MSKNEYSFHTKPRNNINPLINPNQAVPKPNREATLSLLEPGGVKATILQQYDHFQSLKKSDEKIKYLSETQDRLSKEIVDNIGILQAAPDKETSRLLNAKLEHLTDLHKKLKEEYDALLKKELNVLYTQWPGIFEKVLDGINRQTLEHVLMVFEEHQRGRLDSNEAVNHGIDYMTMTYNLPRDFFDRSAVGQFNQNLHKQDKNT